MKPTIYMKKLSLLLVASLLVACSGSSQGRKDDAGLAAQQSASPQGSTNNEEAKKAFEEAVVALDKVKDVKGATIQQLTPAEASLSKAVSVDPGFGKAWFNLGVVRETLNKQNDARDAYLKAVETAPKLAGPHVNLGMIAYEESGDPQAAFPYFEDAIKADRFNPVANSNMSVLYRLKRDYVKAVGHARQSLAGDSQNVDAYANLARAYYELEKYDVALLVCLNAFKIKAERPDIHNIVGLVWLKKSDITEAIRQFRAAIKIDPNYVPAIMNLGAVMLNVRNYDRAIELFDQVVKLEPDNVEAKISSAVAHRGKGDLDVAQRMYDEVQKLDPKNPMIAYNQGVLEHEQYAQNAQKGVGAPTPPDDPVLMMDWQIANIKKSMEHYEKAIGHYNDYLAWEKPDRTDSIEEAKRRVAQVQEVLRLSAEQIPQLEMQKEEIAEDMRQAAAQEAQQGEEQQ